VRREVDLARPVDPPPSQVSNEGAGVAFLRPYRVTWSRDGEKLLAIVRHGKYLLLSTENGISPASIRGDRSNRFIEAWDIPSGRRYPLKLPSSEWTDIAWHPEGRRFATASKQDFHSSLQPGVRIWDLATSTELIALSKEEADRIVWSDDGQYLLAVIEDKKATVYTPDGRETCSWSALEKDWAAFTLSGQGRYAAVGGEDGLIHIRDLESGRELARWHAHDAGVTALTFSPDGALLASGAPDGSLRVWNLPWIRSELAAIGLDW
jgi:WD40 repeat protein